jgi:cytoskeletal protein RodZ
MAAGQAFGSVPGFTQRNDRLVSGQCPPGLARPELKKIVGLGRAWYNFIATAKPQEARLSKSTRKRAQRSNRNVKIFSVVFSVLIVTSVVLGLLGPFVFQQSDDPTPLPTLVFPTAAPLPTLTPAPSATPTPAIPTPVLVTPTQSE